MANRRHDNMTLKENLSIDLNGFKSNKHRVQKVFSMKKQRIILDVVCCLEVGFSFDPRVSHSKGAS